MPYGMENSNLWSIFCRVEIGLKMHGVAQGSKKKFDRFCKKWLRLSSFGPQIGMDYPFPFSPLDAVQN